MSDPNKADLLVTPYLFFGGRCDEAIEFYKTVFDAKVLMLMRYKDGPDKTMIPPGGADKVMHARLEIGGSKVHVSDGHCEGKTSFDGFTLSVTLKDEAEAARLFHALAEGGQVRMPLGKTFFSPQFGMTVDRFGLGWMIYVQS